MSLGRITAAAFSGHVDNTATLAVANFDFSLVKVEAPKEYRELGSSLSSKRSSEAEDGPIHATARKLAALFADVVPKTPHLYRAYGLRASEIARSETYNPRGNRTHGMFADHLGADGTSIWAAATSGESAIALHLLACLLARMWSHTEAVSVWAEFVDRRKTILSVPDENDSFNIVALHASRISISRSQLAAWDASARSWLQVADEVKKVQQTQLILILNNIGIPVNSKSVLYESVLEAWRTSLIAMNNILQGMNQSHEDGASLLGLASWHIYPDMLVLGATTRKIAQMDNLVPKATVITLGIQNRDFEKRGIFWSLPLAYLRHYGDPVPVTRSVEQDTSRLSLDQLLYIGLGSLLSSWVKSDDQQNIHSSTRDALRLISAMKDVLTEEGRSEFSWLDVLGSRAATLLDGQEENTTESWRLLSAGVRKFFAFLTRPLSDKFSVAEQLLEDIAFGLTCPETLLGLMDQEKRIAFMKLIAIRRAPTIASTMIIQHELHLSTRHDHFEYDPVLSVACSQTPTKANIKIFEHLETNQTNWVGKSENSDICVLGEEKDKPVKREDDINLSPPTIMRSLNNNRSIDCSDWISSDSDDGTCCARNEHRAKVSRTCTLPDSSFNDLDVEDKDSILTDNQASIDEHFSEHFDIVCDFPFGVKILAPHGKIKGPSFEHSISIAEVTDALTHNLVSRYALQSHLRNIMEEDDIDRPGNHLKGLEMLIEIYTGLQHARISPKFTTQYLGAWKWIGGFGRSNLTQQKRISNRLIFGCVVACESGTLDLEPDSMEGIMLVSIANSLYVSERLLLDPTEPTSRIPVKHVVGNIGRPGLTLMIAPEIPRIRKLKEDTWNLINHYSFDGKADDMFPSLTLHLTTSDWQRPIGGDSLSSMDAEASLVNGIVSLHDRGIWIADLDILGTISKQLWIPEPAHSCVCSSDTVPFDNLASIDCIDRWEELLDSPLNTGIVRVCGNWQARLALAVLSVRLYHPTFILQPDHCWHCHSLTRDTIRLQRANQTEIWSNPVESHSSRRSRFSGVSEEEERELGLDSNKMLHDKWKRLHDVLIW